MQAEKVNIHIGKPRTSGAKRERYSSDDDDFQTPKSRFSSIKRKRTTGVRVVREEKDVTFKKENEAAKGKELTINTRQSTRKLVEVLGNLSTEKQEILKGMGFECLVGFKIDAVPTALAYWVVDNVDAEKCVFTIGDTSHEITSLAIQKILGFPMGQMKVKAVSRARIGKSNISSEWRKQFGNGSKRIYFKELITKITEDKEGGKLFRLNLMVLIMTTLAERNKCGTVNHNFLQGILNVDDIPNMDWCGYVLECLKRSKRKWNRDKETSWYTGPLLFLLVWYVHTASGAKKNKELVVPAIKYWSSVMLDQWEEDELKAGGFGAISRMHNGQKNVQPVVDSDTTPAGESIFKHEDTAVIGKENAVPHNEVVAEAKLHSRFCEENIGETIAYKEGDKKGADNESHGCSRVDTDIDENGSLNYSAEECESEINLLFNLFCCTMAKIEKTMEDAIRKYPDNECLRVTIGRVKDNMCKVARDNSFLNHGKPDVCVNNDCVDVETETQSWAQIFEEPGLWEKQFKFAHDTLEKKKRGADVKNGDAPSYNVIDCPSFSLGLSPVQLDNSEQASLHRRRLSLNENSKAVTKLQFFDDHKVVKNPMCKEEIPNQVQNTLCGIPKMPVATIHNQLGKYEACIPQDGKVVAVNNPKNEGCKVRKDARKGNRTIKPMAAKRSLCYERVVNIMESLSRSECELSNCIFAAIAPEYDIIFRHTSGTEISRVIFESLIPDSYIHAGVIEAWACILNYEQRFKRNGSQDRIFCGIGMMSANMIKHEMGTPEKYTMFKANMDVVLEKTKTCIRDAELVLIPIIRHKHFYLICFNVKKCRCYVIDNLAFGGANLEGHENIPELLKTLFAMYLDASGHPNAKLMEISEIQRLEMNWRTNDNFVDCGVFTMRHMETFTDEGLLDWDAGFVEEGLTQKEQLNGLRRKYLYKILLSNANELKRNVLTDIQTFKKRSLDCRKHFGATAKERVEKRLKKYA